MDFTRNLRGLDAEEKENSSLVGERILCMVATTLELARLPVGAYFGEELFP